MVVDEQEFRTFLANIEAVLDKANFSFTKQSIDLRIKLVEYKQQIDNQPIKSKWKQLQLPINQ